jgi:Na+/proline symporter
MTISCGKLLKTNNPFSIEEHTEMPPFRLNIFGRDLNDRLVVQLIIGGICLLALLIITGFQHIIDWTVDSLLIWISAMLFFVPISFGFVYNQFTTKSLAMIITGIITLILYFLYSQLPPADIASSVLKSLIWMTLFTIILDQLRNKMKVK